MDVKRRKTSRTVDRKVKTESESNVEWSGNDKRILLKALKTHGSKNIPAISKMLPNIPPHLIRSKIAEYSKLAEDKYEHELLNKWLGSGVYEPGDSLVPEALLCVALFEDHPPPSEAEGYDFKAIYNFLHRSCLERASLLDLSEQDRALLCSVLTNIEHKVWPQCQKDIWEYVGRVYNKRYIKKVYPGKNVHSS